MEEPLDESERGEWKSWLKTQHSKMKIMASGPITSWQIDGETIETVTDYFLGFQIHCRWWLQPWIERPLLLGWKAMTNLDSILKSRDITLPTKVHLLKAMVFPYPFMDVRVGPERKLSTKELMLLNCGVGEDSWESFDLQGDQASQS